MDFENHFSVPAPLSTVWDIMLNADEVAPCVPGAQLTETIDGTHFRGIVKVKLGAVQMTYRGELELEPTAETRTIVLRAKGTEARGRGGASGTFTTVLAAASDHLTDVSIQSHVDVTGPVAQFGRSIMQDVANRLIKDFATCLEHKLGTETDGATLAPSSGGSPGEAVPGDPPAGPPETGLASSPGEANRQSAYLPPPELRLRKLVTDVVRARLAGTLHSLAERIAPQ